MCLLVLSCFSLLLSAEPVRRQFSFEPNQGQTSAEAKFMAHVGSRTVHLTNGGLAIASQTGPALRIELAGSNPDAATEGLDPQPGVTNYLRSSRSTVNVPHFGRVAYRHVYPGIDLVYYFNGHDLEHDFLVAPGARWNRIRFRVEGAERLRLDVNGDLLVETTSGLVRQKKPVVYQEQKQIEGRYVVSGSEFAIALGAHDPKLPLIIDPVTVFGTYLGGAATDQPNAIAVDEQGNTYVTGNTTSANFPTKGALQSTSGGATDVFVTKLDRTTGAIIYSTYIGGAGIDSASAIRVDAAGNVYIAGNTASADFPTTTRGFQTRFGGALSAFALKLNPAGNALVYSTFLNGTGDSVARGLDIDAQGSAYVVGATTSNDFPIRTPFNNAFRGSIDGFVTKLSADGASLVYSSYLAGSGVEYLESIAVNRFGEAFIAGWTTSRDLPTDSLLSRFAIPNGPISGYYARLSQSGSEIIYSSYLGGSKDDYLLGVLPDKTDPAAVYLTGLATSPNFPTAIGSGITVAATGAAVPFAAKFTVPGRLVALNSPAVEPGKPRFGSEETLKYDRYDWYVPVYNDCNGTDWQRMIDQLNMDRRFLRVTRDTNLSIAASLGLLAGGASAGAVLIPTALYVNKYVTGPACGRSQSQPLSQGQRGASSSDRLFGINVATSREIEVPQPPEGNDVTIRALAGDSAGNIYVAMQTADQRLPVTTAGLPPASTARTGYITKISSAGSATPAITSVTNAFGDSATIAPNTWVTIKGANLATGAARIWQGSDFVNNQMPVRVDGVSVTLNGQNAYVWYVSATQLNILTPPNLASGPVQVVVTAGGAASAAFSVQAAANSLSLFIFGAGPYATATHANGALIGPTTLYAGLTTPAQPGESIILYGNGFGPTSSPVVAGSPSQSGTLSPLPVIQIGGVNALVQFAGLVAPGLYQLNVQVPASLSNGDHPVVVQHAGASAQRGVMLTVQSR